MAKRKRKILSSADWWEQHREQFERTERHYREVRAKLERQIAATKTAQGDNTA